MGFAICPVCNENTARVGDACEKCQVNATRAATNATRAFHWHYENDRLAYRDNNDAVESTVERPDARAGNLCMNACARTVEYHANRIFVDAMYHPDNDKNGDNAARITHMMDLASQIRYLSAELAELAGPDWWVVAAQMRETADTAAAMAAEERREPDTGIPF